MAFAIVPDSKQPGIYEKRVELADQTATSAAQDLGKKFSKFRLSVYTKVDGTGPYTYRLDVADDSGFTTNVRTVAVTGSQPDAVLGAMVVEGIAPIGGAQFAKVIVQAGTAMTYDARIDAGN